MTIEQAQNVEIIEPEVSNARPASTQTDEDLLKADIGEAYAALAMAILDEMSCSSKTVEHIAAKVMGQKGRTALQTFYRWRMRSAALCRLYARAREGRADVIADEIIHIVDTEPDPQKARARMDARKWYAGKCNRGLYGDDPPVGPAGGVTVNVHTDHSAEALAILEDRLAKRAKQLSRVGRGMLGRDEKGGDVDTPTHTIASRT